MALAKRSLLRKPWLRTLIALMRLLMPSAGPLLTFRTIAFKRVFENRLDLQQLIGAPDVLVTRRSATTSQARCGYTPVSHMTGRRVRMLPWDPLWRLRHVGYPVSPRGYRGLPPAFASLSMAGSGGWTRPPPGGSRSGYAGCGRHRHQERQNGVSNLRGPVEGAGRDGEGEVSQKPTKGFKTYEPGFGVHRRQIPAP